MPNQKSLVINIADKVFKIKIDIDNESYFLETLKSINLKIKEFKQTYPGLHLQEYLSMAIIWIASEKSLFPPLENMDEDGEQILLNKLNTWNDILNINDGE